MRLPNWSILAFMAVVLVITGVAEYIHISPAGSFYTVLLLTLGIVVPSPVAHTSGTTVNQPQATETNIDTKNG